MKIDTTGGRTSTCPAWCEGGHAAEQARPTTTGDGAGVVTHHFAVVGEVGGMDVTLLQLGVVDLDGAHPGSPCVVVEDLRLDPMAARRLAVLLLDAADQAEEAVR